MSYHLRKIKKGVFGEISKIEEELEELKDSVEQNNRVMALCELSDIYGALRGYLYQNHLDFTMRDLEVMADATERAFKDGTRK